MTPALGCILRVTSITQSLQSSSKLRHLWRGLADLLSQYILESHFFSSSTPDLKQTAADIFGSLFVIIVTLEGYGQRSDSVFTLLLRFLLTQDVSLYDKEVGYFADNLVILKKYYEKINLF